jgi:integrase/recombinase XerD
MLTLSERFFSALLVDHYSPRTVGAWRYKLRPFLAWCRARGVERPLDVTTEHLERFKAWQFAWRDEDGKGLAVLSQVGRLIVIRAFFKWLARHHLLPSNPASEVDYPKVGFRLPRAVFTPAEVEKVLAQPDLARPLGLRNRTILETFYSTGLRRMEVANLDLTDLDETRGTLLVRQGKGAKDRVVPIGERAVAWVMEYLADGRPRLVREPTCLALFLSKCGTRLTESALTKMASHYVRVSELGKSASCHVFRHSAATAMLENGADIRFIQEMLGHAKLTSTQVYTRVSITKLKAVHTATHPAALLEAADGRTLRNPSRRPADAPSGPGTQHRHDRQMTFVARVARGRLVLDVPIDLPEDEEVELIRPALEGPCCCPRAHGGEPRGADGRARHPR